jgi:superfamily II DNA or RNA helicase
MSLTLFPPQQVSHDVLVAAMRSHNAALDSSITGSGKTVKAVEIARTLGMVPLVICPKIVVPAWKAAFEGQGVGFLDVRNYEKIRNGSTSWLKKTGKNKFEWTVPPNTMLIWDEVHRCMAVRGSNVMMLVQAARQNLPCLMLSATAASDPSEMRALGFALGLHKDTNFMSWAKSLGCTLNPWRQLTFPNKARPKLAELHAQIYPDRGHKVSRADMGSYFTETSILADPIDFGTAEEMQKIYEEMQSEMDALTEQSGKDKGASALTSRLRARQAIELLRIPILAEMVKDAVNEGCSVAVFLNFRASMEALDQRLSGVMGIPCQIHGSQTAEERADHIAAFQEDRSHVILCQINAGGAGVNLHDSHGGRPRRSFISPTDDEKMLAQALGRIDRAGSQSDTVQQILYAANTIEEEVAKNFRRKLHNMQTLHQDMQQDTVSMKNLPNTIDVPSPSDSVTQDMTIASPAEMESPASAPATPGGCGVAAQETPPAHAKWSPSKLKYVELCPGFDGREGNVNPAAEMGTRIHEALEKMDLDMLTDNWERLIAERCLESYQDIVERHGWTGQPYTTHHEIRLEISLGDDMETFGTCDVLLTLGDVGIAIDWKTGRGAIDDASINTQAQAYVLGSFQRHPELTTIHFYFVIPQRDEITFHTYRREDCDRIKLRLNSVIRRAEQFQYVWKNRGGVPVEMFHPQPGLCEFCANQWKCHAITKKVFDIANKYGTDGLPVPSKVHGSETEDPEDMAKLLRLVPVIEAWIGGVKSRSKQMAFDEGVEIPGFEPKERAGRRSISSASAAWDALVTLVPDLTPEDFMAKLGTVSFNDAAEIVKDAAPRGKKTAQANAFEDTLIEMGVLEQAPPSQYLSVKR